MTSGCELYCPLNAGLLRSLRFKSISQYAVRKMLKLLTFTPAEHNSYCNIYNEFGK